MELSSLCVLPRTSKVGNPSFPRLDRPHLTPRIHSVQWTLYVLMRRPIRSLSDIYPTTAQITMVLLVSRSFHAKYSTLLTSIIRTDLAEEVKNAAFIAPVAIVTGVVITAFLGFWINVALCVSILFMKHSCSIFSILLHRQYGIKDFSALPGPTTLVFAQVN